MRGFGAFRKAGVSVDANLLHIDSIYVPPPSPLSYTLWLNPCSNHSFKKNLIAILHGQQIRKMNLCLLLPFLSSFSECLEDLFSPTGILSFRGYKWFGLTKMERR